MKLDYLVFCDSTSQDSGGKVSLNGIFDQVFVQQFPATANQMSIAFRIGEISDEHIKINTDILRTEDGQVIGTFEAEADINPAISQRHQVLLKADGFPLISGGTYTVRVSVNGKGIGSDNFTARRV